MRFHGTQQECAEIIAQLDAALGYPRGYTQADVDSGLVVRAPGGIHVPLDLIRTETLAEPVQDGDEHAVTLPGLRDEHREKVARKRVLRILNRGSREDLVALPGIGPTRADALIARRGQGRLTRLEDARDALGAVAMKALRDYAATKVGDADDAVVTLATTGKAKHA